MIIFVHFYFREIKDFVYTFICFAPQTFFAKISSSALDILFISHWVLICNILLHLAPLHAKKMFRSASRK